MSTRILVGSWFALSAGVRAGAADADAPRTAARVGAPEPTNAMTIVVTARKWEEPLQDTPGAVTVLSQDELNAAGIKSVREATRCVPNVTLGDFSVRRLSFPFVRGLGSGRNSPAVDTIIDGVPQLSYATANQELLDVERIEYLRGSQSSLYGRDTLAGAINIVPRLPSSQPAIGGSLTAGNFGLLDGRVSAGGPVGTGGLLSGAAGYSRRDGYTKNDLTGNTLDDREALFGRFTALWPDAGAWSFRLSAGGERDRDGDYTLGDLAAIRSDPHHVMHDYEGSTERDLAQPVFTASRRGPRADFTSITAFQWWRSRDMTDLDASPADLLRRSNSEEQEGWIQEFRCSSPAASPVALGEHMDMRWLMGAFGFHSVYSQRAFTEYRPGAVPLLGIPFSYRQLDDADLTDCGMSLFAQASVMLAERVEVAAGLRYDYEHKKADLLTHTEPALMPPSPVADARDFNETSPRVTLAYHVTPDAQMYVEASKGYKTGGFNAQAEPDHSSFGEENSWTYETGVKTAWFRNRVMANAALFRTEWRDLQLDVPASGMPGVFYIDNAGNASSQGGELEMTVRPLRGLDLFGGLGLLESRFGIDSASAGADVADNDLPFAPRNTWHAGAQYAHPLWGGLSGFVRVDGFGTGRYYYAAANNASQGAYTLVNARLGVETGEWRLEGWVQNANDTDYVPLAFPLALAPSGYVGEAGAPRTYGVSFSRLF